MQIVKEHINFERGLDPKDSMRTGLYAKYSNDYGDEVTKTYKLLKPYLDKYGFKLFEEYLEPPVAIIFGKGKDESDFSQPMIRLYQKNTLGDGIHGCRIDISLPGKMFLKEGITRFDHPLPLLNDEFWEKITSIKKIEEYSFERGLDPKEAMRIGDKTYQQNIKIKVAIKKEGKRGIILREIITKFKSIFKDYLPFDQEKHSAYALEDMQTIWWQKIVDPGWECKSLYKVLMEEHPGYSRSQLFELANVVEDDLTDQALKLLEIPRYVIE